MPLQYRQGDLLLVRPDTRPAALTARQSTVIVAGEATGHARRLQAGTILDAPDGARSVDRIQAPQMVHEDQAPGGVGPGLWLVGCQREDRPAAMWEVWK